MFGIGREKRPEPDQIEVILGPRATLAGDIRCDGSVRLDGTMEGGSIETLGNVLISESAKIMADIRARTVSVAGAFKGSIEAQRVELLASGRIWGKVRVASFLLDEGAFLQGELEMMGEVPEEPFVIPPPSGPIPVLEEEPVHKR
ncbi:MAG: polymer-forming cytoskeletal protein [Anaerolineae bacterium]|nr:polymer-forming cytoskeletal protein [Anaerolineae bacterium]